MNFPWRVDRLLVPPAVRAAVDRHVAGEHPAEAGGYLACRRSGGAVVATRQVPVDNDASQPTRRFETVVDERAPGRPRVFYHSHTSASSPAGLTGTDRRRIPERCALVLFAPDGEVHSYRAFRRGLVGWREITVADGSAGDAPVEDAPARDRSAEDSPSAVGRLPRLPRA